MKRMLIFCSILAFASSSILPRAIAADATKVKTLKKKVKNLENELSAAEDELESAESDLSKRNRGLDTASAAEKQAHPCDTCEEEAAQCKLNTGSRSMVCYRVFLKKACYDDVLGGDATSQVANCWKVRNQLALEQKKKDVEELKEKIKDLKKELDRRSEALDEAQEDCVECQKAQSLNQQGLGKGIFGQQKQREPTTMDYVLGLTQTLAPVGLGIFGSYMNYQTQQAAYNAYQNNYQTYANNSQAMGVPFYAPNPYGGSFGSSISSYGNPYMSSMMGGLSGYGGYSGYGMGTGMGISGSFGFGNSTGLGSGFGGYGGYTSSFGMPGMSSGFGGMNSGFGGMGSSNNAIGVIIPNPAYSGNSFGSGSGYGSGMGSGFGGLGSGGIYAGYNPYGSGFGNYGSASPYGGYSGYGGGGYYSGSSSLAPAVSQQLSFLQQQMGSTQQQYQQLYLSLMYGGYGGGSGYSGYGGYGGYGNYGSNGVGPFPVSGSSLYGSGYGSYGYGSTGYGYNGYGSGTYGTGVSGAPPVPGSTTVTGTTGTTTSTGGSPTF